MAIVNGYLTLAEYKRGAAINDSTDSDATDDIVIEDLIEEASRLFDELTGRTYYPRVETRYHDTPAEGRELWLDDDLLDLTILTNGDDTSIADSDYHLVPKNDSPHYIIRLNQSSNEIWDLDSAGNSENVIDVLGVWGYHTNYTQRAWSTGSTVSDDSDVGAADTTIKSASGTLFDPGQIIRIDDEIIRVTAVSTATLTVVRGENGSTAAAHDDGSTIYIWNVHKPAKTAVRAMVINEYKRRFGDNTSSSATITGAGVVLTPDSIPRVAADIIRSLRRAVQ